MLFSMLVPLSRLISLLTCNIPCQVDRFGPPCHLYRRPSYRIPVQIKHDSANAQSSRLRRTQGPSSQNPSIFVKEVDAK